MIYVGKLSLLGWLIFVKRWRYLQVEHDMASVWVSVTSLLYPPPPDVCYLVSITKTNDYKSADRELTIYELIYIFELVTNLYFHLKTVLVVDCLRNITSRSALFNSYSPWLRSILSCCWHFNWRKGSTQNCNTGVTRSDMTAGATVSLCHPVPRENTILKISSGHAWTEYSPYNSILWLMQLYVNTWTDSDASGAGARQWTHAITKQCFCFSSQVNVTFHPAKHSYLTVVGVWAPSVTSAIVHWAAETHKQNFCPSKV